MPPDVGYGLRVTRDECSFVFFMKPPSLEMYFYLFRTELAFPVNNFFSIGVSCGTACIAENGVTLIKRLFTFLVISERIIVAAVS